MPFVVCVASRPSTPPTKGNSTGLNMREDPRKKRKKTQQKSKKKKKKRKAQQTSAAVTSFIDTSGTRQPPPPPPPPLLAAIFFQLVGVESRRPSLPLFFFFSFFAIPWRAVILIRARFNSRVINTSQKMAKRWDRQTFFCLGQSPNG
jgi:hypothetical protein